MILTEHSNIVGDTFFSMTRSGALGGVAIVGASFKLDSGSLRRASDPLPLLTNNVLSPTRSHVLYELEYSPPKPVADIFFLRPIAIAPHAVPVPRIEVSVRMGSILRELVAVGPRQVEIGRFGRSASEPFEVGAVRLDFESTFGGAARRDDGTLEVFEENPVGLGLPILLGVQGRHPCPQVFWRGSEFDPLNPQPVRPAGLTAVNRGWMPRRQLAGTYDQSWRASFPRLPSDFDPAFENSAHLLMQIDKPNLLQPFEITGMSEEPISFELGDCGLMYLLAVGESPDHYIGMMPDTCLIDCADSMVHLRWRTFIPPEWTQRPIVCQDLASIR